MKENEDILPIKGTNPDHPGVQKLVANLCDRIALIMIPIPIIILIIGLSSGIISISISSAALLGILIFVFWLNKLSYNLVSRLILSIAPSLALVYPFIMNDIGEINEYNYLAFIFIGLALIPLVLFSKKAERTLLTMNLVVHIAIIGYFNYITLNGSEVVIQNITMQVILLILMFTAMQLLHYQNDHIELKLIEANEALKRSNMEIEQQKDEIVAQSEQLNAKELKIEQQAIKLSKSNNELNNTKAEILNLIDKLKEAKDKLLLKEAETKSILNALNDHYLVAQYDLNGKLVDINHKVTELFGNLKPDLKMVNALKHPENPDKSKRKYHLTFRQLWSKVKDGGALTLDIEIQIGDTPKYFSTTLAPLNDSKGKPQRVLAIAQDISELIDSKEKVSKINKELNEKIHEISDQNQLLNHQQFEIFNISEELRKQAEEIRSINESLEERVRERTQVLEEKNKQLAEYAFINSHLLRAPVSTMLGLINLISYSSLSEEDKKIYDHLLETAKILDNIIFKINHAIDNESHFDRNYLEPERDFQPLK